MSKRLLSFLLAELKTVRIVCNKCGLVIEASLASITEAHFKNLDCPGCNADLITEHDPVNPFLLLARLAAAEPHFDAFKVEFIIPQAE